MFSQYITCLLKYLSFKISAAGTRTVHHCGSTYVGAMKDPTKVIIIPDTAASVRGSLSAMYQDGSRPFDAKDLHDVPGLHAGQPAASPPITPG